MSSKLKKLEIKKLIQEYNFLILDNEYKLELVDQEKNNFFNSVSGVCKNEGISLKNINEDISDNDVTPINCEESNNIEENSNDKIKKIFR